MVGNLIYVLEVVFISFVVLGYKMNILNVRDLLIDVFFGEVREKCV